MRGKFFIVATPIGNLGDITLRALETLKGVDFILCEDTRVTKNLLEHYQISKPLISYHQHSEAKKIKEIAGLLAEGKNLALVTDAGTPGISDPGNLLISAVIPAISHTTGLKKAGIQTHSVIPAKAGICDIATVDSRFSSKGGPASGGHGNDSIVPIPGPCALVAALSVSGFPTDKFIFLGFPPHKNKRQKFFKEVAAAEHAVVFYESGHRIFKCLQELKDILEPNCQIVVCRELTKKFETIYRGTAAELAEQMKDERGEFVIVISKS